MYDVIYIDPQGAETQLAQHVSDRVDAAAVARRAAAERGAGRMVLPGSVKIPNCVCVVPVGPPAEAA
jgi:invasion protein IalB